MGSTQNVDFFFGHSIDADGIHLLKDKLKATLQVPINILELRLFIGNNPCPSHSMKSPSGNGLQFVSKVLTKPRKHYLLIALHSIPAHQDGKKHFSIH